MLECILSFWNDWGNELFAMIIGMIPGIWSCYKVYKQHSFSLELQKNQEIYAKELESYKNKLQQQNDKIKHLNEMQMANYTLFAQKKHEACIALYEALNNSLNSLNSVAAPLQYLNTFLDFNRSDVKEFLEEIQIPNGKQEELLRYWEFDKMGTIKKLQQLQRKHKVFNAYNKTTAVYNFLNK